LNGSLAWMELLGGSLSRLWSACGCVSVHHPLHSPILTSLPEYLSQSQLNSTGKTGRTGKTQKAARHRGSTHTYIDPPGKDTKEQRSISISERAQRQQKHQASQHGPVRKSQKSNAASTYRIAKDTKASGERARTRQEKSKKRHATSRGSRNPVKQVHSR
jgi:hypothetical protein